MGGKPAVEAGGGRGRPPSPAERAGKCSPRTPAGSWGLPGEAAGGNYSPQRSRRRRWEIGAAEGTPVGTGGSEGGHRGGSALRNSEGEKPLCRCPGGRGGAAGPAGEVGAGQGVNGAGVQRNTGGACGEGRMVWRAPGCQ